MLIEIASRENIVITAIDTSEEIGTAVTLSSVKIRTIVDFRKPERQAPNGQLGASQASKLATESAGTRGQQQDLQADGEMFPPTVLGGYLVPSPVYKGHGVATVGDKALIEQG